MPLPGSTPSDLDPSTLPLDGTETLHVVQGGNSRKTTTEDVGAIAPAPGQCQLVLSGGNLVLQRLNGRRLFVNGQQRDIPSAGVSLAATGLTAGTLYYIYAYMASGTMTLEASTTVPVADTTTGMQVKTGDGARTLVGMARPVTGPAWVDSQTQRFVLSWFNRKSKAGLSNFAANRTITSATYVEINTEIRVEFLAWGDEAIPVTATGTMSSNGSGTISAKVSIDGGTDGSPSSAGNMTSALVPMSTQWLAAPSRGYHYATLLGLVTGGATGTFYGVDATLRCVNAVEVSG